MHAQGRVMAGVAVVVTGGCSFGCTNAPPDDMPDGTPVEGG